MNEVLAEAMIEKVDSLGKQMGELKEKIEGLPDYSEAFEKMMGEMKASKEKEPPLPFPEKEVRQLISSLKETAYLFKQPVKKEVAHHHHIPKLIWITAGLFLLFCLSCTGWYISENKLADYRANDTKYRYLKLNRNKNLQEMLTYSDSLYRAVKGMRDSVVNSEEENERKFQLLQEAGDKQKEADELRKKAIK